MHKILVAGLAIPALAIAGCAGTTGNLTTSVTPATVSAFTAEVQQYAQQACGFLPAADTIAKIATASSLSASSTEAAASTIATQICGAVAAKGARRGGVSHVLHVGRVAVHGRFASGGQV